MRRTQEALTASKDLPKIKEVVCSRHPHVLFREDKSPFISFDAADTAEHGDLIWARPYTRGVLGDEHPVLQRHLRGYLVDTT